MTEEDKAEKDVALPELTVGEQLSLDSFDKEQHFTQPPAHYTEASLVKALEEDGIGRPSTYAPTIGTLLARRYIAKEKKNIFVTELGLAVDDMMQKNFPTIIDTAFTANMESLLDSVAAGKTKWKTIVENFYPDLEKAVEAAEKELKERYAAIGEMHASYNVENDLWQMELHYNKEEDLREEIFYYMAEHRLPIYEMKMTSKSLEDVFLELTKEQEKSAAAEEMTGRTAKERAAEENSQTAETTQKEETDNAGNMEKGI